MNKYIPKVGESFEWQMLNKWVVENKVVFDTDRQIAFIGSQGLIHTMSKQCMFRPIQTKSNVEREQLIEICFNNISVHAAKEIQKAGFTIPKKVKRSELKKIINHHHSDSAVSYTKTVDILICKLLGDLVGQDEGGDV
jgi:hypothetical protein